MLSIYKNRSLKRLLKYKPNFKIYKCALQYSEYTYEFFLYQARIFLVAFITEQWFAFRNACNETANETTKKNSDVLQHLANSSLSYLEPQIYIHLIVLLSYTINLYLFFTSLEYENITFYTL